MFNRCLKGWKWRSRLSLEREIVHLDDKLELQTERLSKMRSFAHRLIHASINDNHAIDQLNTRLKHSESMRAFFETSLHKQQDENAKLILRIERLESN